MPEKERIPQNIKHLAGRFYETTEPKVVRFLLTFYAVGVAGTLIPFTRGVFLWLFPFAIILSFVILLAYSEKKPGFRTYLFVVITALAGYFIEVAGVNTGEIFGRYSYGRTLGPKIFNTPPLIGINWALLVFATASVTKKLNIPPLPQIIIASLLMVLYDFFMEMSAPTLGMWYWENDVIPFRNYLAWFAIAFVLHSGLKLFRADTAFKTAPAVLICQILFFVVLAIYFNFAE